MGAKLVDQMDALAKRRTFGYLEDFLYYTDGDLHTKTLTATGTAGIVANGAGGQIALATSTTLNSSAVVAGTAKTFLIAANKSFILESYLQYAEANTNTANIFVGFSSVWTGVTLVDGGAGPATSFSGAAIYKQSGETVWRCITSIGSAQTITKSSISTIPAAGTGTFQRLRVEMRAVGTNVEAAFWVDNGSGEQQLLDTSSRPQPIKHVVAFSGAAAMAAGVMMKNNSTTAETLNVDYLAAYGLR